MDLDNALCKEMMAEYIRQNPALWDKFLAELNPDLLKPSLPSISIRHHLLPGDVGYITYLHAVLYAPQQGWDHTFDSYVAIPLAQFALRRSAQERIWIVEKEGRIVGCAAIVKFSETEAQLRWLLLHPDLRSQGLGRKLVEEALLSAGMQDTLLCFSGRSARCRRLPASIDRWASGRRKR